MPEDLTPAMVVGGSIFTAGCIAGGMALTGVIGNAILDNASLAHAFGIGGIGPVAGAVASCALGGFILGIPYALLMMLTYKALEKHPIIRGIVNAATGIGFSCGSAALGATILGNAVLPTVIAALAASIAVTMAFAALAVLVGAVAVPVALSSRKGLSI